MWIVTFTSIEYRARMIEICPDLTPLEEPRASAALRSREAG